MLRHRNVPGEENADDDDDTLDNARRNNQQQRALLQSPSGRFVIVSKSSQPYFYSIIFRETLPDLDNRRSAVDGLSASFYVYHANNEFARRKI